MTEAKLNPDLMKLNRQQLSEHVTRSEIRRKRRELLENIFFAQNSGARKAGRRRMRLSRLVLLLVIASTLSASYLIYSLTSQ